MNTSEAIDAIALALAKAQAEFPKIEKGRTAKIATKNGGSYEYSYADIADVLSAMLPVLAKHEMALVQPTSVEDKVILVRSRLMHGSGQWIESIYPVCSLNGDHKAMGSALTYARRYAACSLLGVVADDDVDGEGAAEVSTPQHGQRQPPRPPAPNGNGNGRRTPPAPPTPRPDPHTDFEGFGTWLQGKMKTARDVNDLADVWNQHVEDLFESLLPPDKERLSALYTRYQERLS